MHKISTRGVCVKSCKRDSSKPTLDGLIWLVFISSWINFQELIVRINYSSHAQFSRPEKVNTGSFHLVASIASSTHHFYTAKRQTSNSRWQFLKFGNKKIKTVQNHSYWWIWPENCENRRGSFVNENPKGGIIENFGRIQTGNNSNLLRDGPLEKLWRTGEVSSKLRTITTYSWYLRPRIHWKHIDSDGISRSLFVPWAKTSTQSRVT